MLNFIVGVPRSGTTLLRAMLGGHPRVCAPSETPWVLGVYDDAPSWSGLLRYLVHGRNGPVRNINDVSAADVTRAAEAFLRELFASKMQPDGKDILVLKTPDDIWFAEQLIETFPRAKILHVQRDVRDVALSTMELGWPTLNHFGEATFANAVRRWVACEEKIAALKETTDNILSLRFEDLVTSPEREIERAAAVLDIEFDPAMLNYAAHLTDAPEWEAGSRDVRRHGAIKSERAWVYRSVVPTEEQLRAIDEHADKIQALGYPAGWSGETRVNSASAVRVTMDARIESPGPANMRNRADSFLGLAPFLDAADDPAVRSERSRPFDARLAPFLGDDAVLPTINCFYEVLSDGGTHRSLRAAAASMRALGHPVRVWSYSPEKLEFLQPLGVELRQASDVIHRTVFERVLGRTAVRYFSDIFRYALLYEHGGLWMDTDVIMLRPFPFRGDYFLNLEWRGGHAGHYICGNVMYAKPYSVHMRSLYGAALDRFSQLQGEAEFGAIGPKLLSEYVMSDAGAELRDWVFSPMLFNTIDWTELDTFERPIRELGDYLNNEQVFGVHLWNALTNAKPRDDGTSLISLLSDPATHFPPLIDLADRFDTDKNRHIGNQHCYARIYDRLLRSRRLAMRRILEIGLSRWNQSAVPSVAMWQAYFPFCEVIGVDRGDFSALVDERFSFFMCDQSQLDEVRMVAEAIEPGSLDMIIDDGSHASADQQMTFSEFFPLLAEGGWYFIEDLDWQPPGEDRGRIAVSKELFSNIQAGGTPPLDPYGVARFADDIAQIRFFDSHYELWRGGLLGGLVAIRKRGGSGLV